ncbi:MAG: hypothetical protein ACRDVW_02810, partial [Acidimicrobiales bacterium]
VIYLIWTWRHTGTLSAFSKTERGGWHSYLSIAYPFTTIAHVVAHPSDASGNQWLVSVCIIAVVIGVWIAVRDRQPTPILIYGILVAILAVLTAPVGPRPRIILDAFPLIMAVGLRYHRGWQFKLATVASVGLLVGFTAFELASWAVFP